MNQYYAVIEVQINDGIPSSTPVVFKDVTDNNPDSEARKQAVGELYAKLGYAYQNQRDYTAVIILNENGDNITTELNIPFVLDNREEKDPVFSVAEIQINDGVRSAVPVNVQVGENAQSVIMQAYHHSLEYGWNVKRNYTMSAVIGTDGMNARREVIDFMPKPEPEPEEEEETAEEN